MIYLFFYYRKIRRSLSLKLIMIDTIL